MRFRQGCDTRRNVRTFVNGTYWQERPATGSRRTASPIQGLREYPFVESRREGYRRSRRESVQIGCLGIGGRSRFTGNTLEESSIGEIGVVRAPGPGWRD